jgi:hypothetical protein
VNPDADAVTVVAAGAAVAGATVLACSTLAFKVASSLANATPKPMLNPKTTAKIVLISLLQNHSDGSISILYAS